MSTPGGVERRVAEILPTTGDGGPSWRSRLAGPYGQIVGRLVDRRGPASSHAPRIRGWRPYIRSMTAPKIARSRRAGPVLICKKCLKRSPGGTKIQRELKHGLKQRFSEKKRNPRLVSTGCFGICPKRAVVLASSHSLRDQEYVLVARRGEVDGALDRLLPP
jgi:hypothetical protein